MSVMRNFESKIAGLVEGAFGRAFRSEVKPVELARRLTREMDDHRTVSMNRTHVPTDYVLWLSRQDRERYQAIEMTVIEELVSYLLEHARSEHLALARVPHVEFATDDRLALGESHAEARLVGSAPPTDDGGQEPVHDWLDEPPEPSGHTMIFSTADRLAAPLEHTSTRAVVVLDAQPLLVGPHGAVLGRSRECDIVVASTEVSRRHARIALTDQGWAIEDLGSTNGSRVNGRELKGRQLLGHGDTIELGGRRVDFELQ